MAKVRETEEGKALIPILEENVIEEDEAMAEMAELQSTSPQSAAETSSRFVSRRIWLAAFVLVACVTLIASQVDPPRHTLEVDPDDVTIEGITQFYNVLSHAKNGKCPQVEGRVAHARVDTCALGECNCPSGYVKGTLLDASKGQCHVCLDRSKLPERNCPLQSTHKCSIAECKCLSGYTKALVKSVKHPGLKHCHVCLDNSKLPCPNKPGATSNAECYCNTGVDKMKGECSNRKTGEEYPCYFCNENYCPKKPKFTDNAYCKCQNGFSRIQSTCETPFTNHITPCFACESSSWR